MLRAVVLLLALGGLVWWLRGEEARGRFRKVDAGFLEVLLANSRDRFVPDATRTDAVVFLPLRQEEKAEFAAWPPQPVDYQMILQGAMQFDPAVIVLADSLHWPEPKPPLVEELAQLLLPHPAVVVTASTYTSETKVTSESEAWLSERLGTLSIQRGENKTLLSADGSLTTPEPTLLRVSDPALLPSHDHTSATPMLGVRSGSIHPAPALLGAFRALNIPVSSASVALGGGAGVLSDSGLYLPLAENGTLVPAASIKLNEQNALSLMTVSMVDDPNQEIADRMGRSRVVVIGMDGPEHVIARQQALALAHTLALPRVEMLSGALRYLPWGVAALLGLSLLTLPREKALSRALVFLLFGVVACYLLFMLKTIWFSPTVPACLLLASGVFLRLFGRTSPTAQNG